jgi:phage terminase small subunit
MNERQRRFVAAYIACRNVAEAALRAGYSPAAPAASGCKQLRKPAVLAALRAGGIDTGADGTLLQPLRRDAAGLNRRQARFVAEYRRSRNAKDAAKRAGYAPGGAAHTGSALLRFAPVIAALRQAGVAITYGQHPRDQIRRQRASFARRTLTARQQRFIAHYLVHGSGRAAALHAGFSPKNAATAAWQVLQRPLVAAAIAAARAKLAERAQIDAARVTAEYARIAFANIADIVDWGPKGVSLKPDARLTASDGAAVLEITLGPGGEAKRVHIKMQSKLAALDALARHLGIDGKAAATSAPPEHDKHARDERRARVLRLAGDRAAKKKV